jgi:hypothetical protein
MMLLHAYMKMTHEQKMNQTLNSDLELSSKVNRTLHQFTISVLFSVFLLPY